MYNNKDFKYALIHLEDVFESNKRSREMHQNNFTLSKIILAPKPSTAKAIIIR